MAEMRQRAFVGSQAPNIARRIRNLKAYPACPTCAAKPGYPCVPVQPHRTSARYLRQVHDTRKAAAREQDNG